MKKILGVAEWPAEANLKTTLPNTSGIRMPVSTFSVASAAIIPSIIFLGIRWITWVGIAIFIIFVLGVARFIAH